MEGQATEKVFEGKLLTIKTEFDDKIRKVLISGDFFAYPEVSISKIEQWLTGLNTEINDVNLTNELSDFVKKKKYQLIGITPGSIVRLLKVALK